ALLAYALVWAVPDFLPPIRPVVSRPWPARVIVSRPLRWAGNATLPVLAFGSVAVIAFTLRPDRPANVAGPVIPGLQGQAGQPELLAPADCETGGSPSAMVDGLLAPVARRYAVYVFDVDEEACYVLSANTSFPPPRGERIMGLVNRAPSGPAPVPGL